MLVSTNNYSHLRPSYCLRRSIVENVLCCIVLYQLRLTHFGFPRALYKVLCCDLYIYTYRYNEAKEEPRGAREECVQDELDKFTNSFCTMKSHTLFVPTSSEMNGSFQMCIESMTLIWKHKTTLHPAGSSISTTTRGVGVAITKTYM